jgi:hypothetical protein
VDSANKTWQWYDKNAWRISDFAVESAMKRNEANSADFQADSLACRGDVIMLVLQRNRCSDQIDRILIQPT